MQEHEIIRSIYNQRRFIYELAVRLEPAKELAYYLALIDTSNMPNDWADYYDRLVIDDFDVG